MLVMFSLGVQEDCLCGYFGSVSTTMVPTVRFRSGIYINT